MILHSFSYGGSGYVVVLCMYVGDCSCFYRSICGCAFMHGEPRGQLQMCFLGSHPYLILSVCVLRQCLSLESRTC